MPTAGLLTRVCCVQRVVVGGVGWAVNAAMMSEHITARVWGTQARRTVLRTPVVVFQVVFYYGRNEECVVCINTSYLIHCAVLHKDKFHTFHTGNRADG